MSIAAALAGIPAPASRRIAGGAGWSFHEFVCHSGPGDRPFEERHGGVSIAAVMSGTFTYTADTGRALLHPGALLMGNHGACYQCGHEHGAGDRCLSVRLSPDYFGEVAATAAGSSGYRFPAAMLASDRSSLPGTVLVEALGRERDPLRVEERLVGFVAAAVRAMSGAAPSPQRVSPQDAAASAAPSAISRRIRPSRSTSTGWPPSPRQASSISCASSAAPSASRPTSSCWPRGCARQRSGFSPVPTRSRGSPTRRASATSPPSTPPSELVSARRRRPFAAAAAMPEVGLSA